MHLAWRKKIVAHELLIGDMAQVQAIHTDMIQGVDMF